MRALLLAGVVAFVWAGTARAAVIEYTSQASFDMATSGVSTYAFSNPAAPWSMQVDNPYASGPLQFTSDVSPYGFIHSDGAYGSGVTYYSPGYAGTIAVTGAATAVSFHLGVSSGAGMVDVLVNGMVLAPLVTTASRPAATFIGFVSDAAITSVSFSSPVGGELDVTGFQAGSATAVPVPEPATLALVVLPLSIAGLMATRRRQTVP